MKNIVNKQKIQDANILELRSAIEHRATWFYLLLDEARKQGADWQSIGRAAIFRCGCFHGDTKIVQKCENLKDAREFANLFAGENIRKVFEMEFLENTKDTLSIDFHYCPLVAAWEKLGIPDEDFPIMCDIAMDGDRGMVHACPGYEFKLDGVIASGDPVCRIRVKRTETEENKDQYI